MKYFWVFKYFSHLHACFVGVKDDEGSCCQVQSIFLHEVLGWFERSSSIGHLRTAGVCWTSFFLIVQLSRLFKHKESISMISISFRQNQGEQQLKDHLTIINRVSRNISNKPMPELRQCSEIVKVENRIRTITTDLFLLELMSRLDMTTV